MLTPKNWDTFQHYKDRNPAWIKLHRGLLDDFAFSRLPLASRALAPLLWLLASEYEGGKITATPEEIAFRFRTSEADLIEALNPLIVGGFFKSDSALLAPCKHDACLEKRTSKTEENTSLRSHFEISTPISVAPSDDWPKSYREDFWNKYPPGRKSQKKKVGARLDALRRSGEVTWARLIAGLDRYIASKPEPQFTKGPLVWLTGGCWDDEYAATKPQFWKGQIEGVV